MNMQLSKTPIGLDGIPAAETVLSHVDGERGELIIAGERVGDLARKTGLRASLPGCGAAGPASRSAKPPSGPRSVRAANARSPGCRICWHHARAVDRRRFSRGNRGAARGSGLAHEATIVGAFPVIAGALVQRAKGNDPSRPIQPRAMPPTRCR